MSTATLDNSKVDHPAVRQLREAQAVVEKIKNDAPQHFPEAASVGDAVRQGDIYIQRIEDVTSAPMLYSRALQPVFPMQLADGNTKGSRHCLAHGNGVTVYSPVESDSMEMFSQLSAQYGIKTNDPNWRLNLRNAEWADRGNFAGEPAKESKCLHTSDAMEMLQFAGPIFVLTETNTVTHPEHGDWIMPPGSYRVTYQRTVARDNVVSRVLD
jgi:hypothetical protein